VGVVLHGPPPASLVPVISHDEYVEAVRRHMLDWPEWMGGLVTRGNQSYAVLSMCRGLRTWRTGEHVSKREAARWACEVFPEHAPLIREAVIWRAGSREAAAIDGTHTREPTRRFMDRVTPLFDGQPD
jgi:hypothetical protein